MTTYDTAKLTMARYQKDLIVHENVTHVAIVKQDSDFVIEVGLISDESCAEIRHLPILPDSLPVPDSAGNVAEAKEAVRVVKRVVGRARRYMYTGQQRPAQGGDSIGTMEADTGTLGALWRINDAPYVISCHHVLYGTSGSNGNDVLQPGPLDNGVPGTDVIAQNAYGELSERLDIAFARLIGEPGNLVKFGTRCFGEIPGFQDAAIQMEVRKCGRTSEATTGTVQSTDAIVRFPDGVHEDQVMIHMQSRRGDSGAVVIATEDHKAVGVLMGGSETQPITYANKFSNVLAAGVSNLPNS